MEKYSSPVKIKQKSNEVYIPASPFMQKIGFGTGVAVYKMQRSVAFQSPWAVKKLIQKQKNNKELDRRLEDEANVLRRLNHPNIVGFRAFVKDAQGKNILAMEECSNCLGEMIEECNNPFSAKIIWRVCRDIANALEYLHNEALLLHCDIKSYNILVKGDFEVCKLCDFGVCLPVTKMGSIDVEKCGDEVEYTGTPAWLPPEILKFPQEITIKADIYSYGLVIWEMIALMPPVDDDFADSFADLSSDLEESIEFSFHQSKMQCHRNRPPLPDIDLGDEYNEILEIFYNCTENDRNKRPSAKTLTTILYAIYEEMK